MPNINILDKNTINQIAAGEVVERPCSVVKELVENAIDAKALAITVEIKDGGIGFIRVSDNGSGIEKEDIKIAFLRHSTSKIKTALDLLTASSLGFRGEALSSIASVALVELVTKTRSSFIGNRYVIEGGEEKDFMDIGCPEGTTFIVKDLFYNTPARRKFLKSPMTEASYISELMERMAISNPNISFKYMNNNKTILHTSGNGQLKDIIYHIYGRDITNHLLLVYDEQNGIKFTGYIGKPIISRGNRNYENYFINGRYIKSSIITKAIEEAYKPFSMQHKYPFTVLNIEVDSNEIDVNVHPAKLEIRFADGESIYRSVFTAVKNTLAGKNMIENVTIGKAEKEKKNDYDSIPEPFETARLNKFLKQEELKEKNKSERENEIKEMERSLFMEESIMLKSIPYIRKDNDSSTNDSDAIIKASSDKNMSITNSNLTDSNLTNSIVTDSYLNDSLDTNLPIMESNVKDSYVLDSVKDDLIKNSFSEMTTSEQLTFSKQGQALALSGCRIIGQLFSTYWLAELNNQLYIIDQHAAHEKIIYEELLEKYNEKNPLDQSEFYSQIISPPIILTLSPREVDVLNKQKDFLESFGFTIEHFGGKEYAVSSIPADIYNIDGKELIISFLGDLADEILTLTPKLIFEKIALMSCKAAIKANQVMSIKEAEVMINRLTALANPFHCPHGRPVIIAMSKNEIEKKFKRII